MGKLRVVFALLVGFLGLAGHARADTPCAALTAVTLPHASVTAAALIPAGAGKACKINVTSRPTADSDIRIEVWIPEGAAWNGRYLQSGTGGFAGSIRSESLAALAAQGFAAAATDDGHQTADFSDARWAADHPEKVTDYAWRALKETTDAAKALIAAYRGGPPKYSYFNGCSNGGREALMEAQRFPTDFDGIIAGAPAADMVFLQALGALNGKALLSDPGAYIPPEKLRVLEDGALAACGGGTYVADPLFCHFDPSSLICAPGQDPAKCLTPAQASAAAAIYGGLIWHQAAPLYPGYTPGAEAEPGSWASWITGPTQADATKALIIRLATNFFRYIGKDDPGFSVQYFDMAELPRIYSKLYFLNAVKPDLAAFRDHGGKLIQYHGWNDPAIPARASIAYRDKVVDKMGDVDGFYRLYMIPGMLHCGGGQGPSQVNWISLIEGWVEHGRAPEGLQAWAKPVGAQQPGTGAEQRLCPYPKVAVATGPESARCEARAGKP